MKRYCSLTISVVHVRGVAAVLIMSAGMLAQSPPNPCPSDTPVDDFIAEIHKQQSKRKSRNTNPLPNDVCVFGWCRETGGTTPPLPPAEGRGARPTTAETPSAEDASSSRTAQETCLEAMERAFDAAHNVEVGDFSFERKNYNAALMRYKDADNEKPGDLAIHVRLGRVFEKLNQLPQAIEQYQAAEKLRGPQKWADEAHRGLARLQRP